MNSETTGKERARTQDNSVEVPFKGELQRILSELDRINEKLDLMQEKLVSLNERNRPLIH